VSQLWSHDFLSDIKWLLICYVKHVVGGENVVAVTLIVQHVHSQLLQVHIYHLVVWEII